MSPCKVKVSGKSKITYDCPSSIFPSWGFDRIKSASECVAVTIFRISKADVLNHGCVHGEISFTFVQYCVVCVFATVCACVCFLTCLPLEVQTSRISFSFPLFASPVRNSSKISKRTLFCFRGPTGMKTRDIFRV